MDTPGEDAIQKKFHNATGDWLERAEASQPAGRLIKPTEAARAGDLSPFRPLRPHDRHNRRRLPRCFIGSRRTIEPVMRPERSERRKVTARAASVGLISRRSCEARPFRASPRRVVKFLLNRILARRVHPSRFSPFTRMPIPDYGLGDVFRQRGQGPLEVEYGDRKGCPPWLDMLTMFTIEPAMRFSIMSCSAPCIRKKRARTFSAKMRSKSSGVESRIVPARNRRAVDEIVDPREVRRPRRSPCGSLRRGTSRQRRIRFYSRPCEFFGQAASADCVSPADDKTADHFFGDQLPGDRLPQPPVLPVTIATLVWGSVISCTYQRSRPGGICPMSCV